LSNLDLEHHHSFEFKPVGQFRGASLLQEQSADKKFVKYFLLTAKDINGNGWGVSQDSIASNIKDFIGQPLVATSRQFIADSEYGDTFTHPYIPTNHIPTIFAHQNKFAIGIIRDVVEEHGNWNAIAEIFPKYAHMKPPPFCSPGIFQLDPREPEGNISKWKALHLAVLDAEPAYGAQMAIMKGSCVGTLNECKVQFKGAKFESSNTEQKKEIQREELETIDTEEDKTKTASVVCPIKLGQKLRRVALMGRFASIEDLSKKERLDLSTGEYGKYKRHDPELPLKNEVPFGRENRSVKQRKEDTKNKIMQGFESITNDSKIRPPKPTTKDRQRIITAKFQLITGLKQKHAKLDIPIEQPPNVKINPEHGKIIADAYGKMKHDPSNPEVKQSYDALIKETGSQYKDLLGKGLKVSKIKGENPYKSSKDMHNDLEQNNHLHYYPTKSGFGSEGEEHPDHPMLQKTEFKDEDNEPMLANDVFRIVHDINGHHRGGMSGFGPKGEQQAFLTHSKMYSPTAKKALATETMGQNNFVNFGPNGEHNRKDPSHTIYAEQKAGIMPDEIVNGNFHQDNQVKSSKQVINDKFQRIAMTNLESDKDKILARYNLSLDKYRKSVKGEHEAKSLNDEGFREVFRTDALKHGNRYKKLTGEHPPGIEEVQKK